MDIYPQLNRLRHLESQNQLEAAESLCLKLLRGFPLNSELLIEAARMALRRYSYSAAELLLYRALSVDPLNSAAYLSLGMTRYMQNDLEDAERYIRKALLVKPCDKEAHWHLGALLNELGRFHEAASFLAEAHLINPGSDDITLSLADSLFGTGQSREAYHLYKQIIKNDSDNTSARISISAVCELLDRLDEAKKHLSRARELAPDNYKVYLNLGGINQRLLKLDDALACYTKALELSPDHYTARWNICQIKLLQGQYLDGFSDFDSRFNSVKPVRLRETGLPAWDGSISTGKRILVQGEQAFGDTIQFVRYIPLLAERGLKVIFENHLTPLNSLLFSLVGLEEIIDGQSGNIDCECTIALQSLPRLFSTTLETIPNRIPYLSPTKEKVEAWRMALANDKNFKVGICWAGRKLPDHRRSIPVDLLNRLNNLTGISWYSLKVAESGEVAGDTAHGITSIIDLTANIHDFEDTAALVSCLDLIITVDSAVAHLAGALGAPTWLLLAFAPDWRWLLDRKDSPWYPSINIFRQPQPEAWIEVLENVATQLQKMQE